MSHESVWRYAQKLCTSLPEPSHQFCIYYYYASQWECIKYIPHLHNNICELNNSVGNNDATKCNPEATASKDQQFNPQKSLHTNWWGKLNVHPNLVVFLHWTFPSICHWTYFHTSKSHVTRIIKKVNVKDSYALWCGIWEWCELNILTLIGKSKSLIWDLDIKVNFSPDNFDQDQHT